MPRKGTKKVKAHIRRPSLGQAIRNPFRETKVVQPYYRKKHKKRKR